MLHISRLAISAMSVGGHLRPSCTIAADGSLSPDSFRARRMPVTEEMGPGCVKTRTLFFKVEFWPRLGGNSSQEIFRHHREGTTKEKILSRSHEGAFSHSLGHKQTKSTFHG